MSGSLSHSPADIVRRLLVSLGAGTLPTANGAWPIFVGNEPPTPDSVTTLYDTQGRMDGRSQIDGEQWEHHGIQARVRAALQDTCHTKARAIAVLLDETIKLSPITISTSTYTVLSVDRVGGVIPLGTEPGTGRFLFTINAVVALRQTS